MLTAAKHETMKSSDEKFLKFHLFMKWKLYKTIYHTLQIQCMAHHTPDQELTGCKITSSIYLRNFQTIVWFQLTCNKYDESYINKIIFLMHLKIINLKKSNQSAAWLQLNFQGWSVQTCIGGINLFTLTFSTKARNPYQIFFLFGGNQSIIWVNWAIFLNTKNIN